MHYGWWRIVVASLCLVTQCFVFWVHKNKRCRSYSRISLLRSRSGRSHVTLSVPTRLLQTDIHSFLGNKPINEWLSFCCECSRLWLVQRIQWQLNERLIGPSKQKRKTPRKECMSVWSSRVETGSVTWLRPERLRRRLLPYQLEPEYSSTDERSESEEEEEDDSIFSNANTSDRRLDMSWCLCEQCTIMPTEVKSICCKEPAFLSKMVEGIMWIKMLTLLSSCFAFAAFLNEESCLTSQLILYCSVTTIYCHQLFIIKLGK